MSRSVNPNDDSDGLAVSAADYHTFNLLQQLLPSVFLFGASDSAKILLSRRIKTVEPFRAAIIGQYKSKPKPMQIPLIGPHEGATREEALLKLLHEVEDLAARKLDFLQREPTEEPEDDMDVDSSDEVRAKQKGKGKAKQAQKKAQDDDSSGLEFFNPDRKGKGPARKETALTRTLRSSRSTQPPRPTPELEPESPPDMDSLNYLNWTSAKTDYSVVEKIWDLEGSEK